MITKRNATIGAQYRHPSNPSFGVGTVTHATLGLVTLRNGNGDTTTLPFEDLTGHAINPVTPLDKVISESVSAITTQIQHMTAMAELPYVRTFTELQDHMDATVMLTNHVPVIFPRHEHGPMNPNQVQLCNVVSDAVDKWLTDRYDSDPYNQPAPATPEAIRDILVAMLNMSHDEIQWGNAKSKRFDKQADDGPAIRIELDGRVFMVHLEDVAR
jgi:hypothetical protein